MILTCGDALIDFVPGKAADGREALIPMVGGSCLNVAVGLARLEVPTGFVGGISTDLFGSMIADHAVRIACRPALCDPWRGPDHARLCPHGGGRVTLRLL